LEIFKGICYYFIENEKEKGLKMLSILTILWVLQVLWISFLIIM